MSNKEKLSSIIKFLTDNDKLGITQQRIADALKVNKALVSRLKNGLVDSDDIIDRSLTQLQSIYSELLTGKIDLDKIQKSDRDILIEIRDKLDALIKIISEQ